MWLRTWILLFLFQFGSLNLLIGQKYDYTWLLGYTPSTGYDPDSMIGFTIIPFEDGIDNMFYKLGIGQPRNTNAHISDPESGQLLVSFDGCRIYNGQYEVMENGDSLFHGIWWKEWCDSGSKSYTFRRGGVILSFDQFPDEYIIVHPRDTIYQGGPNDPINIYNRQMNYSRISFQSNDNGTVLEKSIPIYFGDSGPGILHAVKHSNNKSWWVMTVSWFNHAFIKIYVDLDTIYKYDEQKFVSLEENSLNGGQLKFSPQGDQLALCTRFDGVHLFNFDRSTGMLSNHRIWDLPDTNFTLQVIPEFSPNGRFLYVSNMFALWQIDTWASDLNAGTTLISVWDGLVIGGFHPTSYCDLTLAPDCKMYLGTCGTTKFLHVIHNPDLPGMSCGFESRGVTLKSINGQAMPLFVNYRLGSGPVCDPSLATSTESIFLAPTVTLEVSPVPCSEVVWVHHPENSGGKLFVYDSNGREVYQEEMSASPHAIAVLGWSPGLYFLSLYDREGRYASGKMVVK